MRHEDPEEQLAHEVPLLESELGRELGPPEREIIRLVIRLRRKLDVATDYARFAQLVTSNLDAVLAWTLRWRVSVLDTFTDHGDALLSRNAHLIVTLVGVTRLAEVEKRNLHRPRRLFVARHMRRIRKVDPADPWLLRMSVEGGDISLNLVRRTERLLRETPLLVPLWEDIMRELVQHTEPRTCWGFFAEANRWFKRWTQEKLFDDPAPRRVSAE